MGKEVWLLLKYVPFWTWGKKEDKTFWYPSMKLFRQRERGNWNWEYFYIREFILSFFLFV